jgi:ATP-dependent DNA ligase
MLILDSHGALAATLSSRDSAGTWRIGDSKFRQGRSSLVRQYEYQPCIPTRGTKVPAGPDWLHEIKHDGYRLIVQRERKRVRLFTRNGYDWSDCYPLIVEAALRNRSTSFVIDGEERHIGFQWAAFASA